MKRFFLLSALLVVIRFFALAQPEFTCDNFAREVPNYEPDQRVPISSSLMQK